MHQSHSLDTQSPDSKSVKKLLYIQISKPNEPRYHCTLRVMQDLVLQQFHTSLLGSSL